MLWWLGDVRRSYLNVGLPGRKCRDRSVVDTYVAIDDFIRCVDAGDSHADQSVRCKIVILSPFHVSMDRR